MTTDFIYNEHETECIQLLESNGINLECWTLDNDVCKYLHHPDSGLCFHVPNSNVYDESEELFNTFFVAWDKWSTGRGMYVFDDIKLLIGLLKFAPHIDTDEATDMDNWERTLQPFIASHDYNA